MIHLNSSKNRKQRILSGRISLAGFGAVVAAAALMVSANPAQAGKKELDAVLKELPANATAADFQEAVKKAIQNNSKLKPGIIVGEALKLPAAIEKNAGAAIAQGALDAIGAGDRAVLIGDAAKTASTGKGANALQVPDFTKIAIGSADPLKAAELARASKTAVGAIIGGSVIGQSDANAVAAVDSALKNKKIAGAITSIAQFVTAGRDGVSAVAIANGIVNADPLKYGKLTPSIAAGVAAGAPNSAGDVVQALFNNTNSKAFAAKAAASIAKSVAAVADIEQISLIGVVISDQIGSGAVKTSVAAGLAKTLAQAITKKATAAAPQNSALNKADEIAEVAAYVTGGLLKNTTLTGKTAPKLVLAIIKAAIAGGKTSKKDLGLAPLAKYIQDVVTSVALTVADSNPALVADIKAFLLKNAKGIAGAKEAANVTTWLNNGFDKVNENLYENGTLRDFAALIDPETDKRNF